MNSVVISGRIVKKVELTEKGVAQFTVAVAGYKEHTDFVPVVAFGKVASVIEKYTDKGSKVLISGAFNADSYEKDGKKVYTYKVICNSIEFLDSKKADDVSGAFNN